MTLRYRLDRTWRRPGEGQVVIAGSPLRVFRLSAGGAHVIERIEAGDQPATRSIQQFVDRFVDAGALHPLPAPGARTLHDVTLVVPAYRALPERLPEGVSTIIVDDASPSPLRVMAATRDASIIRRESNGGPAAARNTGLALVTTPFVAFVDTDVVTEKGVDWIGPLLDHFDDERVALVAPRVMGAPGRGRLAEYDEASGPLDLGPEAARIAAGTRVSYVPAAAVVCRTAALRQIGGFDETLRLGEDVDLVWRLTEAGHRCRYEPSVVVHHRPRTTASEWVRQRVGYGRSAASLARRHPGALAPVRLSPWSALAWALLLVRRPFGALASLAVVAGTVVTLRRKLADLPATESAWLAILGHVAAGRQLAKATTRVWWPIALLAAVTCRRARVPVAAAVVTSALVASGSRLRDAPIAVLDDVSYGAGVWSGVVAERQLGPLVPEVRWPR